MNMAVKIVTYWIVASALTCPSQARPRPEPVMMELAKAMIPQVPRVSPCYQTFPLHFSIGKALARIFAPNLFKTQFTTCFPGKKTQIKL